MERLRKLAGSPASGPATRTLFTIMLQQSLYLFVRLPRKLGWCVPCEINLVGLISAGQVGHSTLQQIQKQMAIISTAKEVQVDQTFA
jgi:hypothetical protein